MTTSLLSFVLAILLAVPAVDTKFAQVAPQPRAERFAKSTDQDRAVVLVQGLYPHPFSDGNVAVAMWQDWQQPDSELVRSLRAESDVYSLGYAQHVPLYQIIQAARLNDKLERLQSLGYTQIVLVGHSAGGLIARQFVEDHPDAGVTKVVQVCSPNGGSLLGHASISVRRSQEVFLTSLTKKSRAQWLASRRGKRIPDHVEFACVVGHQECRFEVDWSCRFFSFRPSADFRGDWIVSSADQWTPKLQQQGIPIVPVKTCHLWVVQEELGIETIARLVREEQPRWAPSQVAAARRELLGKD